MRLALKEAGLEDAAIENEDGELTIYVGEKTFTATPIETSKVRAVRAGEDDSEEVTEAKLITEGDTMKLEFQDSKGVMRSYGLFPVSNDAPEVINSIEAINGVEKAEVNETGGIDVNLMTGEIVSVEASLQSTTVEVPDGEPLEPTMSKLECDFQNEACHCKMTYMDTTSQCFNRKP